MVLVLVRFLAGHFCVLISFVDQVIFGSIGSSVQEELAVCSSAGPPVVHSPMVRPVVVSWLGSDGTLIVIGTRGPVSRRSTLVEVNHPDVDFALSSFPEGRDWMETFLDGQFDVEQFDDILV